MLTSRAFVPRPRPQGVISQELDGELLLYVEETHRASSLNASAARIWMLCDGQRAAGAIAVEAELGSEVVLAALRQFADAGLLENASEVPSVDLSRRRMLRTVAIAGPAVLIVMAPLASAACSLGPSGAPGAPCVSGATCCSTVCEPITGCQ
jgi:hypothetical protein